MRWCGGKVAGAERLVGPARRIRAGFGHGTFSAIALGVQRPQSRDARNIFRDPAYVNYWASRAVEKPKRGASRRL